MDVVVISLAVCADVDRQRFSTPREGCTDLSLTPLQKRAFEHAVHEMECAARKLDEILERHAG